VLLVDDDQAEAMECNRIFDERVCADYKLRFAARDSFEGLLALGALLATD